MVYQYMFFLCVCTYVCMGMYVFSHSKHVEYFLGSRHVEIVYGMLYALLQEAHR